MSPPLNAVVPPPSLCRRRDRCRLCDGTELVQVLSLAPSPPANAFVPASALGREQHRFPLDVWFCEGCAHVQLLDVVDPGVLFEHYVYASGTSPVFVTHFKAYAAETCDRFALRPGDFVVDIGSNDGTLLRFFQDCGQRVLGIDPARDIARAATDAGLETIAGFFTPALAEEIRSQHGPARVITANNVFAHIDDLSAATTGVRTLLAPDGVFRFEVSYLLDVFDKTLFDTIYHEHLDYHTLKPLLAFFAGQGLELIAAERVDSHGGSLRATVRHAGGPHPVEGSVAELVDLERRRRLDQPQTFQDFGDRIHGLGKELVALLEEIRDDGKHVAGFGAPAKATTLMHHFGIANHLIDFIVDDSPLKQGLYTPGYHVPVVSSTAIYESEPEYLLILAWNFAPSIMARHQRYSELGGRFIVPLPQLRIV